MATCDVNLFGRVQIGHIFAIICKPIANCKNFKINFTDGGSEIPLTIFVNLRLNEIVLNSYINFEWRESYNVKISSFDTGGSFKIYVLTSDTKFHVALNEREKCSYSYCTSVDSIKSIQISGELERVIQVDHRRAFPSAWPPIQNDYDTASFSSHVPYLFSPGSLIVLKMRASGDPKGQFTIRFNERGNERQLLQLNPRFADRVFVVNTMTEALKWFADEKRFHDFPFRINREFQLAIAMTSSRFKVAVDGRHLLSYEYRMIQLPKRIIYSNLHPLFDVMTGINIFASRGMKVSVSKVSHFDLNEDCDLYENFSNPSYT